MKEAKAAAASSAGASDTAPPPSPATVLRQANAYGNSPLHEAAINGHDDVAAFLLATEDQATAATPTPTATTTPTTRLVDLPNKRGSTPLFFALYGPDAPLPLVERLLARGADPGRTDHDGVGVLHVCASQGHEHLLPLFLARFRAERLDVAALAARRDANGHDPAFYAQMKGHAGVVRLLEEAGKA